MIPAAAGLASGRRYVRYISRRRSQIESDGLQLCLIGIVVALLTGVFAALGIPEDSIFWTDKFAIPFVFGCVIALFVWGWYSTRIIKIIASRAIMPKGNK